MTTTAQFISTTTVRPSNFDGQILYPGSRGYDSARSVWNGMIDHRPELIVRCASVNDVVTAVRTARERDLEIGVRCGGHNIAGLAVPRGGLMIDLTRLGRVTVDPAMRRAWVQGGALLGALDRATQPFGLATTAGNVSHTGAGGLTLGGGMGWLTRKFGLSIDNLLSAEVVTADGRVLRASAAEHPDLFWAIRGGGGTFGIVTSFEFDLHELDPTVQFAMFFWGLDQGPDALRLAREITAAMPPDINAVAGAVNAPPAPFVPEQYQFAPGYVLLLTGFGGTPEHARLVDQVRGSLPPLFDLVAPMGYAELQQLLDEANAWGFYSYDKSSYLADLSDPVIDVVTEHVPGKNSPLSALLFYRLDGAYSQVGDQDTAFSGGRSPRYAAFIIGMAMDEQVLAAERGWVRGLWTALRPLAIGGGYINGSTDYAGNGVRDAYGAAKYERLARVKAGYDPDNVFNLNANVPPAR